MFLRIFSLSVCVLSLAACGGSDSPEPEGATIDCAIGPGADYSSVCTLEAASSESEPIFLIHHPDGGFRRLGFDPQTRELTTIDGAERLEDLSLDPTNAREFAIGEDRYVVPLDMLTREP